MKRPVKQHSAPFGTLFVGDVLEKELDTIGIVNELVPRAANEKGPTVGESFFFLGEPHDRGPKQAGFGAMVSPDGHLADPARGTPRACFRALLGEVGGSLEDASGADRQAFHREALAPPAKGCTKPLFDTINYYTYMASRTHSELTQRGHNKSSKHHLRHVGVRLLLDRDSELPLYYKVYPGNLHDAKLFYQVLDELFGVMADLAEGQRQLTVVFDKGMNAAENIALIDG